MNLDLCRDWKFSREGGASVRIDIPHDAMLTEKRNAECRNGVNTGYFPGGKYIYEKAFFLDESLIGKSVVLHFEGVYQNCRVCLNGVQVGAHRYGYTPFNVDISDAVQSGENLLRVMVDNSLEPNCRWYSGSGIYRPVSLIIREKNHICDILLETVDTCPARVRVTVRTTQKSNVKVEFYDGEALVVSGVPGIIEIPDGKLWSAEEPFLYDVRIKTDSDEQIIPFGIRKLEWNPQNGLTVNGKRVLLQGGCIHHDHGILGACEYPDAEERRIRILKENGYNAIRMAHNPASQITLNTCDKLGMYVMNEAFDGWYTPKTYHDYSRWFETDWKEDLCAMVRASHNHPSVILYSIGNEVTETVDERGIRLCAEIADYVRSLDRTRPVTAGVNVQLNVYAKMGIGIYSDKGEYRPEPLPSMAEYREKKSGSAFFNAITQRLGKLMFFMASGKRGDEACCGAAQGLDVLGLNYASSRYDADIRKYPNRLMVGSETLVADLPYNWERVKKHPQLLGDFVWAAWDYLGEACMGWTYHSYKGLPLLANQGMIDITGKPLAGMVFQQIVWGLRKEPFIGVRPLNHAKEQPVKGSWQFTDCIDSWNWPGYEGKKAVVEVYAAGYSVRLLLNGRKIGQKRLKDFRAVFCVRYEPGSLIAEVMDSDDKVMSSHSLSTGYGTMKLTAYPEKQILHVQSGELCYITVEFTDEMGLLLPAMEQRVDACVEGPAKLLGFGSALYKTDESFDKAGHFSYRGRCLAVIQAGEIPGKVCVSFHTEGAESAVTELHVINKGERDAL